MNLHDELIRYWYEQASVPPEGISCRDLSELGILNVRLAVAIGDIFKSTNHFL